MLGTSHLQRAANTLTTEPTQFMLSPHPAALLFIGCSDPALTAATPPYARIHTRTYTYTLMHACTHTCGHTYTHTHSLYTVDSTLCFWLSLAAAPFFRPFWLPVCHRSHHSAQPTHVVSSFRFLWAHKPALQFPTPELVQELSLLPPGWWPILPFLSSCVWLPGLLTVWS